MIEKGLGNCAQELFGTCGFDVCIVYFSGKLDLETDNEERKSAGLIFGFYEPFYKPWFDPRVLDGVRG